MNKKHCGIKMKRYTTRPIQVYMEKSYHLWGCSMCGETFKQRVGNVKTGVKLHVEENS